MTFRLANGKAKFETTMKIKRTLIQICLLSAVLLQTVTSKGQPVTKIAAGDEHGLFLKGDGSLWDMGWNKSGQLGDGTYNNTNRPEQIVPSGVTAINAGKEDSIFLKNGGSLWAMGRNDFGQVGDGTYNNTNRPELIVSNNVTAIAAGWLHSLFLKSDGSLWAMGYNEYGQLGDGTTGNTTGNHMFSTNRPELIVSSNVVAISAGIEHSLFLKSDGSLWAMGDDETGQLGDGYSHGTLNIVTRPEQIVASGVTTISGGGWESMFLKSDGSLWVMGDNQNGELGDGTYNNTNRPEQILAAYNQISSRLLGNRSAQLSFVGVAGANYALDHSFSLMPANWVPQVTNAATSWGTLVFTNTPDPTTNNFWRIRSVP